MIPERAEPNRKRVLISGAGIAGPTLAWWLSRFGFDPAIVEIAPEFRAGGYMIDFWGKGYDLVDKMGLLPAVEKSGYRVQEVRLLDSDGSREGGFSVEPFYRATGGRFISLARGDLAKIIWNALPATVETMFADEIRSIETHDDRLGVSFASGKSGDFDFVIGADGLHSRVREICFGPQGKFEKFLGINFAAFTVDGYEPRNLDIYMMYGVAGQQAARFTMRGNRSLVLLLWRDDSPQLPQDDRERRALLLRKFSDIGWEARPMLEALDRATDLYVDRMSQIYMPQWARGRIGLVGDAAWAPSFLAGEGTGLGIIGGYVLAGELGRSAGDPAALKTYENRLRTFIERKQTMATHLGGAFVPKTRFGVRFRNWAASALNNPLVAKIALASGLRDNIDLPDYGA